MQETMNDDIKSELHVKYFVRFLQVLPSSLTSLDTNRLMLVYFACSALDVLGRLDAIENKAEVIDFIYANQVRITGKNGVDAGGFIGGAFTGGMDSDDDICKYHCAHVSMTYCALLILTILGDDFSRVDRKAICAGIKSLQQEDGSFMAVSFGTERDMRFVFSAVACCFMLQDFTCINVEKVTGFIISSQSYDGGFGILPGQEAHSGAIYCALASLALLGQLKKLDTTFVVDFLSARQVKGFNGRINKVPDTCYTFWVGGALQVLGLADLIETVSTREFIMQCQSSIGGFSKHPGDLPNIFPDPLHAHYSIMGLSLIGEKGFLPINSALGITSRAFDAAPFSRAEKGPLTATGEKFCQIVKSVEMGET